nr:hypothetical protein [Tanacetum cinerariifolium]
GGEERSLPTGFEAWGRLVTSWEGLAGKGKGVHGLQCFESGDEGKGFADLAKMGPGVNKGLTLLVQGGVKVLRVDLGL